MVLEVTFDGEIIGIFWDVSYIHSNLNSSTNSSSTLQPLEVYIIILVLVMKLMLARFSYGE